MIEDVVVKIRRAGEGWVDYGRDTMTVACTFVASPAHPMGGTFEPGTEFVAVDDWGSGKVVAATDAAMVGHTWRDVCQVERLITVGD